jgi:hypothetical protein
MNMGIVMRRMLKEGYFSFSSRGLVYVFYCQNLASTFLLLSLLVRRAVSNNVAIELREADSVIEMKGVFFLIGAHLA